MMLYFFFFKQKTAYEIRSSDWSSDVCSSDLALARALWSPGERAAPRAGCLDVMAPVAGLGGRAGRSRRLGGAENAGAGEARQGGYRHDLRGGRRSEIDRGSWRGRVCPYVGSSVVAVARQTKYT